MTSILSIQGYRGGTGRTTVAANLAWLAARLGRRVALVDLDLRAPGLQLLPGTAGRTFTVTDHQAGRCSLEETAYDVSRRLGLDSHGALFLLPARLDLGAILAGRRERDLRSRTEELRGLGQHLDLDLLVLDTPAGFQPETLWATAAADHVLMVTTGDRQDLVGLELKGELCRRLHQTRVSVLINRLPARTDPQRVIAEVERRTGWEVLGALPLEAQLVGHGPLVARDHPDLPMGQMLTTVCPRLLGDRLPAAMAS